MLTLSTGTVYRFGLNRIFEFGKELGFDGIEIVMNEIHDTRDAEYIGKLQEHFELPVVALTLMVNNSPQKIKKAIEVAEKVGVPTITMRSPLFTDYKFTRWFKKDIPLLQKKTPVRLAVENVPAGKSFFLPQYSIHNIEDLKAFDYLSLDTSHLASQKLPLLRVYKIIRKRLVFVHVSNYDKGKHHQLFDDGEVPIESFFTHLRRDDYKYPISLKFSTDAAGGGDLEKVFANLKNSIKYYQDYFLKKEVSLEEAREEKAVAIENKEFAVFEEKPASQEHTPEEKEPPKDL